MTLLSAWAQPLSIAGMAIAPAEIAAWAMPVATFVLGLAIARNSRGAAKDGLHGCKPVIPSYRSVLTSFTRELDRVRRYDRALSVLVLKLEDSRTTQGSMGLTSTNGSAPDAERESLLRATRQVMFWNVGYALLDLLRETDVAACDVAHRRYVLLLPEAGEELASLAAQRIEERLQDAIGVSVRKGIAVYRSDGLTIGDLVGAATAKCDRAAAARPALKSVRSRSRFPRIPDPRAS